MKKKARTVLMIVLAVLFAAGAAKVVQGMVDSHNAKQAYENAQKLAFDQEPVQTNLPAAREPPGSLAPELPEWEPLEENARFLMDTDLEALRRTNEAVLGWIHIPDSPISYPLIEVQDNQEYLRRAWDGTPNQAGCIFLESRNRRDLSDFNTIIFGHFMNNGTMFGSLHNYKEKDYWDTHPYIYIVTDGAVRRYQVFAAYEAGVQSDTYRLYFEDDARRQSVLDHCMESSIHESELTPTTNDRILTLSTCTGTGTYHSRWVVQAVLTGEFSEK